MSDRQSDLQVCEDPDCKIENGHRHAVGDTVFPLVAPRSESDLSDHVVDNATQRGFQPPRPGFPADTQDEFAKRIDRQLTEHAADYERLGQLQPSDEWMEGYRAGMAECEAEHHTDPPLTRFDGNTPMDSMQTQDCNELPIESVMVVQSAIDRTVTPITSNETQVNNMSEHQTESWSKPLVNLFRRRALRLPSIGISIGDTVPLWGHHVDPRTSFGVKHRLFYAWANRGDGACCGGIGFKAGFIFVRISSGRSG